MKAVLRCVPGSRPFMALACLLAACLAGGCASSSVVDAPPIKVSVAVDAAEYRVGEPVVATVTVLNEGTSEVTLAEMGPPTLSFLLAYRGSPGPVRHRPVESAVLVGRPRQIEGGGRASRRFLLTQLTEQEGPAVLTVGCRSWLGDTVLPTMFSPAAEFTVTGPVAYRRDRASGLIVREQATELAAQAAGGEVLDSRLVLVPLGQSGLYTWVARLTVRQENGAAVAVELQVNPYSGRVGAFDAAAEAAGGGQGDEGP